MSSLSDSFVASWKPIDKVQERINARYDSSFITNVDGTRQPYVCTFCDEFLLHEDDINFVPIKRVKQRRKLFSWDEHVPAHLRISELEKQFSFIHVSTRLRDRTWLDGLALSPRGTIGRKNCGPNSKSQYGFSSCGTCKWAINNSYTPFLSIVNQNFVGNAPECLRELTEVERSLVTPVKGCGYCHTYTGGKTMNLKGTLTFMRVQERRIARVVAQFQRMGLTKHVLVLLTGNLTGAQKTKAKKKHEIRTDKVIAAVEWLISNHRAWKGVDIEEIREELSTINPIVIDNSVEVESENSNVENYETFTCFFPDRTTNTSHGGFDEPGAFQEYVQEMQRQNFDVEVKLKLQEEFLRGDSGVDELVMGNLLQFPYGVGGLYEKRLKQDGSHSFTDKVPLANFLKHLSLISQPEFQTPLFQLIMYTHISRYRLLSKSRLQLRSVRSAAALAEGINERDLRRSINGRSSGNRNAGTFASKQLLNAVDAMSKALPHTNEASRVARSNAESLQHHFGIGTIWLTVNFDDENSLLLQVLSGRHIDDDTPLTEFTDDELHSRHLQRRDIRLQLPGLSAMNFEVLIHIVFEEVLGWDMRRNCATKEPGLFGFCEAVCMALEEQGRKTIHGHITAWIRFFNMIRRLFFFGRKTEKEIANQIIAKYSSHVSTTALFKNLHNKRLMTVLDHECSVPIELRNVPEVVSMQNLRELRHRLGWDFHNGKFAYCLQCTQEWTYDKMVEKLVRNANIVPGMIAKDDPDRYELPKARMAAHIIQFQMKRNVDATRDVPSLCINAYYQHHVSHHLRGCFKCQKRGKSHSCGPYAECECRFRMPDLPRQRPVIKYLQNSEGVSWYTWDGALKLQPLLNILPSRHKYDLFQNVSCTAISESKMACNTNIALITDGPVSQYNIKYQNKDTRSDDTREYQGVLRSITSNKCRVHEDDKKEALRIICRAGFAHNRENVIGAPFASYLTRHDTRFYFSHKFQVCPLKDFIQLLNNNSASGILQYTPDGDSFFENQALNYLCRPNELELETTKTFFENYTVRYLSKKRKRDDDDEVMPFLTQTEYFMHPSVDQYGEPRQGVEALLTPKLIKVPQWEFPDSAKFEQSIFTVPTTRFTPDMEKYALLVLILFFPFRGIDDLLPEDDSYERYPFMHKFLEIYEFEQSSGNFSVFSEKNREFLQNIQNTAYNSLRYKADDDDLKSQTTPFQTDEMNNLNPYDDEDLEDDLADNETPYEVLLDLMDEVDTTDNNPICLPQHLSDFSFIEIRNHGTHKCGYEELLPTPNTATTFADWISEDSNPTLSVSNDAQSEAWNEGKKEMNDIVRLLISRKEAKTRPDVFVRNPEAKVVDADGTISSIKDWETAAGMDDIQRRAFESIIASFLLTFCEDAEEEDDGSDVVTSHSVRSKFRRHKKHLMKLVGGNSGQLICLLHGPGGSGKSTVINLVIEYAKEFCKLIGHRFTSRTIVITAMSGVAATLLHGETTHKALGLNCKQETIRSNEEMIEAWSDARLVFVDEISFATEDEFNRIYQNLGDLMRNPYKPYGGLRMVFAGDYSQLEPPGIGRRPIYQTGGCPCFNGQLTTYIELDGKHRFKDDPEWGNMLLRFRNGEPTLEDIRFINEHCLISSTNLPPPNTQIATYRNKDRDAVNCALFEQYCDETCSKDGTLSDCAMLIFMDDVEMMDGNKNYVSVGSNSVLKTFWSKVGEAGASDDKKRVDPCLKLYPNCPLMFTDNADVAHGQANGSRVNLVRVNVKVGERPMPIKLQCGAIIRGYRANQIASLHVRHEFEDICPREFLVTPKQYTFRTKFDTHGDFVKANMKGVQFPLISNSCTTGHKLQGYTADTLLVNNWEYKQNWAYVVLSRVRTMKGLYLRKPLSEDLSKYKMPPEMLDMIEDFQSSIAIQMLDDEDYDDMIATERTWFVSN